MIRSLARCAVILLGFPVMAVAQDTGSLPEGPAPSLIQTELRLERRLLVLDLLSYSEARERDRRARHGLEEVLGRLDQALAGDAVTLGGLEALQDDLDAARAAVRITEQRLGTQLERIQERLRRIGLLEGETGARVQAADPVTGRWRVTVFPQNLTATFDLRLNGTVVSGSYRFESGSAGSFRGTFAGGNLRLERIDARGGFDSVWEGTVAGGRIAGTWTGNELVTGQPNRGDWTAVREGQ
jgi:hypothetical protein